MNCTRKIITSLFFGLLLSIFSAAPLIFAQEGGVAPGEELDTNPKDRELEVTAIVPVLDPPPVPILISPPNNSFLTSGAVTFVWREVTGHLVSIDRYELTLNGSTLFGNISTANQETNDYVLVYDGTNYSLTLKPGQHLPDGVYTWRIRVVDNNDRGTNSATWTFTIDSQPPPLIITQVDGQPVFISANDPDTIPGEPIEVRSSRPQIIGFSEPGAEIELTITLPDGSILVYKVSADVNGIFGFVTDALPPNQVVSLRFVAIDKAGNTTVLDGVQLVYRPPVIVIPIPPIIPDLPPEIIIPIPEIPVIPRPEFPLPFPPFVPEPVEPEPPVRVIEIPVFDATPWLVIIFLGLLLYVLMLFWLTGNQLGFLLLFMFKLLSFFFFPWSKKRHEVREQDDNQLLPWLGFRLLWVDNRRKLRRKKLVTDISGRWDYNFSKGIMYQFSQHSGQFEYPGDRIAVSDVRARPESRDLYLTGESVWLYDKNAKSNQTTIEYFAISRQTVFNFVVWLRCWRPGAAHWRLFLPRVFLFAALAASAWIAWNVPLGWSWVLLLIISWIVVRDVSSRLPRRLSVYTI